eukprot:CFRG3186T1
MLIGFYLIGYYQYKGGYYQYRGTTTIHKHGSKTMVSKTMSRVGSLLKMTACKDDRPLPHDLATDVHAGEVEAMKCTDARGDGQSKVINCCESRVENSRNVSVRTFSVFMLATMKPCNLPKAFCRIFCLEVSHGQQIIPPEFHARVAKWFAMDGDVDDSVAINRTQNQKIVRVLNLWTFDQAVYNPLRQLRPIMTGGLEVEGDSPHEVENCDFCQPLKYTGEDPWGRIYRNTCMTGSNVAKSGPCHSLVVFTRHSPLALQQGLIEDIVSLSEEWFFRANMHNPLAVFPTLTWNCQAKAGASQPHGHAQLLLEENSPFATYARLRDVATRYKEVNNSDYFSDLVDIHTELKLTHKFGRATVMVPVVPRLTRQLTIVCPSWLRNTDEGIDQTLLDDFTNALSYGVHAAVEQLGFRALNVNIGYPPLDRNDMYKDIPVYGVILDRGPIGEATSDVCSLTLMGFSSAIDPFVTMRGLSRS